MEQWQLSSRDRGSCGSRRQDQALALQSVWLLHTFAKGHCFLFPAGLGCPTTLSPEGAAQFAAQIFGLNNHLVWSKLRASMLNTWISLKQADKKLRECSL